VSRRRCHSSGRRGARRLGDGDVKEEATPCLIRLDDGGGSRWSMSRNDAAADPGDSGGDKSLARMGQVAVEP
jgi:hypothetical protein